MAKTQIVLREELEEEIFKLANELHSKVSLLNMMKTDKSVFGDRRTKKNIKLQKFLTKYLKF